MTQARFTQKDWKVFYTRHSPFTTPGPYAHLYADLPHDLDALCEIVNGLIVHDLWIGIGQLDMSKERKQETEIRSVQVKLRHMIDRDSRPLVEPRPFEERLFGNCRDQALLLCSFLRHGGIPSRMRTGFMTNAGPRNLDHAVCQVWSERDTRWRMVDVQMDSTIRESDRLSPEIQQYLTTLTPHDTPPKSFVTGGQAWLTCRSGKDDPMRYGIEGDFWGLQMVRHSVLRDLLALNKYELLPWDDLPESLLNKDRTALTPDQLKFLDHVAKVTSDTDRELEEIQRLYQEHPSLHVPADWVDT